MQSDLRNRGALASACGSKRGWILMVSLAVGAAQTGAVDAPKDAARNGAAKPATAAGAGAKNSKNAQQVVGAASAALLKEYAAHQKDPSSALRQKSNYITEHPST